MYGLGKTRTDRRRKQRLLTKPFSVKPIQILQRHMKSIHTDGQEREFCRAGELPDRRFVLRRNFVPSFPQHSSFQSIETSAGLRKKRCLLSIRLDQIQFFPNSIRRLISVHHRNNFFQGTKNKNAPMRKKPGRRRPGESKDLFQNHSRCNPSCPLDGN